LLRLGIAERRRLFEPLAGGPGIARHAGAILVDRAKPVHGGGLAKRAALFEQAPRFGIVAANAFAVEIEQAGDAGRLGEHIGFIERMGVDRNQIIEAMALDAVAGIVEQRDVGSRQTRGRTSAGHRRSRSCRDRAGRRRRRRRSRALITYPTSAWRRPRGLPAQAPCDRQLPITSATRFSACAAEPMPAHIKNAATINRDMMPIRPAMTTLSASRDEFPLHVGLV